MGKGYNPEFVWMSAGADSITITTFAAWPPCWYVTCWASHFSTETGFWIYYIHNSKGREQLVNGWQSLFAFLSFDKVHLNFLCIWVASVGAYQIDIHSDNSTTLDEISTGMWYISTYQLMRLTVNVVMFLLLLWLTLCSVTVFVKLNEQGGEGSDVTNVTNVVSKTGLKVIQHFQLSL